MSSKHFPATNPPSDAISAVKFSPDPDSSKLLVASWDKNAFLYNIGSDESSAGQTACSLVNTFEHRAPLLDVCFGASDDEFYSAGLDWDVRHVNVATSAQTVLSTHDAAVKSITFSKEHSLLVSASWDATLHVHHRPTSSSSDQSFSSPAVIPLPSKVFAMSATPTKIVVAMASRVFYIFELSKLAETASSLSLSSSSASEKIEIEPYQRREGSLKFMTRAVATMPTDAGYASSSIEGRVAVEWFDASSESQSRKYAFKCHRQTQTQPAADRDGENAAEAGVETDVVYPVNALAFHPIHGTFASGGGDGVVALWDGVAKRRIRQYPKYSSSVAALAFSADGKYLAVGVSPGFEDGKDEIAQGSVGVFIRELGPTEAKGKGAK